MCRRKYGTGKKIEYKKLQHISPKKKCKKGGKSIGKEG